MRNYIGTVVHVIFLLHAYLSIRLQILMNCYDSYPIAIEDSLLFLARATGKREYVSNSTTIKSHIVYFIIKLNSQLLEVIMKNLKNNKNNIPNQLRTFLVSQIKETDKTIFF